MSQHETLKTDLDIMIDGIGYGIHNFIMNIMKKLEEVFSDDDEEQSNVKQIDIKIPTGITENYSGVVYDIYYYLMLQKKENKLNGFTIRDFNYGSSSSSFNVAIDRTKFQLKILALTEELNCNIYTALILDNAQIKNEQLSCNNIYKRHTTYNSIIQELYRVRSNIKNNI